MSGEFDEEENDYKDKDDPLESDMDSFDEPGVMPCPHCRQMISEDAEMCPHCRNYISAGDAPRKPIPAWLLIGLVAVFAIILIWLVSFSR